MGLNPYLKGVSLRNIPDMPTPPAGSSDAVLYQHQSARLMFYHDHAIGITRLNVYAGMAAGYLIHDPVERHDRWRNSAQPGSFLIMAAEVYN